jgi:hypothetical protein
MDRAEGRPRAPLRALSPLGSKVVTGCNVVTPPCRSLSVRRFSDVKDGRRRAEKGRADIRGVGGAGWGGSERVNVVVRTYRTLSIHRFID